MLMHKVKEQIKPYNNRKYAQQSANQTMEKAFQSANETGEDVAEVGSQVKEGAKDLIGNIGDKLEDLGHITNIFYFFVII